MKRLFSGILAFAPAVLFAAASPAQIHCPASIDVSEHANRVDAGWEATPDEGRRGYSLEQVSFYDGHPREMASLVPDDSTQNGMSRSSRWTFSRNAERPIWVACSYQNTRLMMTRALPPSTHRCVLKEQLLPSGATLKIDGISCE